jgi:hypothetical protein
MLNFVGFIIRKMPITRSLLLFPNNDNDLVESAISFCNFLSRVKRGETVFVNFLEAEEEANPRQLIEKRPQ